MMTPEQKAKIDNLEGEWGEGGTRKPVSEPDRFWQRGYAAACRQIKDALNNSE